MYINKERKKKLHQSSIGAVINICAGSMGHKGTSGQLWGMVKSPVKARYAQPLICYCVALSKALTE